MVYSTAGSYQDTIFGGAANGCDSILDITINQLPNITEVINESICSGSSVTINGTDYSVAGNYLDTIFSGAANGCDSILDITITVGQVDIACSQAQPSSGSDGIAEIDIMGGTGPYTIDWAGPSSGSTNSPTDGIVQITGLEVGQFTITVTDANGCMATCDVEILSTNCTLVIDSVVVTPASCIGNNDGEVVIYASGGTPPYEYSINGVDFFTDNVFKQLPPGPITVYVTDDADCNVSLDIDIPVLDGPELSILNITQPSCGIANGSVEFEVTGGTMPYSYSINGVDYVSAPFFNGLGDGNYQGFLIDAAGCEDTIDFTLQASDAPVIIDITTTPAMCGAEGGQINVTANGGQGDLVYSYDGGLTFISSSSIDTSAGIYNIVVMDEAGCTASDVAVVTEDGGPEIDNIDVTPTDCDSPTGQIEILASGGQAPLSYSINGIDFQSSPIFANLPAGPVTITVRDANGCEVLDMVNIAPLDGPVIEDVIVDNTTCGEENGGLQIIVNGGQAPITYDIGSNSNTGGEFTGLEAGIYDILVTDASGCTAAAQAEILDSDGPRLDIFDTPETCDQSNGSILADGQDGTGPYLYSFNGGPFLATSFWSGLQEDIYTIVLRDAQGCEVEEIVLIRNRTITFDSIVITPADCGQNNGSVQIFAQSPEVLEYSVNCVDYTTDNLITGLAPGVVVICVRMRDYPGCQIQLNDVIPGGVGPQIDNIVAQDTDCEVDNGSIEILASGGTGDLEYSINGIDFQVSNLFGNLAAGNYDVFVRDENNCDATGMAQISSATPDSTFVDTLICEGDTIVIGGQQLWEAGVFEVTVDVPAPDCDSVYIVTVTTEVCCQPPEYTYQDTSCFEDAYTFFTQLLTISGTYQHIITDGAANGCDSIVIVELHVRPEVSTALDEVICEGEYFVVGMDTFETAGVHNVVLQDQHGCDSAIVLTLGVEQAPDADAGLDQVVSCGQQVAIGGVNAGLGISWEGPGIDAGNINDPNPLVSVPGMYIITVTSPLGCTNTDTVEVTSEGVIPTVAAEVDSMLSCIVETAEISTEVTGTDLEFMWTGPGINSTNENNAVVEVDVAGTYIVFVTDTTTGCASVPDTVIVEDIAFDIIAIIEDPEALNCYSTFIDLDGTGSSPTGVNIEYVWQDLEGNFISSSPLIQVDSGGMYLFTVIDTLSGCFDQDTVEVTDLTAYPPIEAGDNQDLYCEPDYVILNEGGVIGLDNVIVGWTGPAGGILSDTSLAEVTAGTPGWYYVSAIDTTNGCMTVDSVEVIDETAPPTAEAGTDMAKNCLDDVVELDASGSSTGNEFSYHWTGPGNVDSSDFSIIVIDTGTYYLTVVNDVSGCFATDSVDVFYGNIFEGASLAATAAACEGDASGTIMVTDEIGGTPPYQYSLGGIEFQNSPLFAGLVTGLYTVVVVDANGCEWQEDIFVPDGDEFDIDIGLDIHLALGDSMQILSIITPGESAVDSIAWDPGDALSCNDCFDPYVYAINSTQIIATIYAGEGCVASDALQLYVDKQVDIYVPNAFSPNGDGVNEIVTVYSGGAVTEVVEFEIFDRWGEKVFARTGFMPNDEDAGWDGTFKGLRLNPGVFVYRARVRLLDNSELEFSGDITLVR